MTTPQPQSSAIIDAFLTGNTQLATDLFNNAMAHQANYVLADYKDAVAPSLNGGSIPVHESVQLDEQMYPFMQEFTAHAEDENGNPYKLTKRAYSPKSLAQHIKTSGHKLNKIVDCCDRDVTKDSLQESTLVGNIAKETLDQLRAEKEQQDKQNAIQAAIDKAPTISDDTSILGNTTAVLDSQVAPKQ